MKKNLLVMFGAPSPEYYVSCETTSRLIPNIDENKYNIFLLGITRDGKWFYTTAKPNDIEDGKKWLELNNKKAIISPESNQQLLVFDGDKIETIKIDVAFITMPGEYGEDGKIPALLEMANIPFVGSRSISSGCCLDKMVTRLMVESGLKNIKQAKAILIKKSEYKTNREKSLANIKNLGFPVFVKPTITGSSIGISKVIDESSLDQAISLAFEYCDDVLIEENIDGWEIKVALYGNNENLIAGSICQLMANNEGTNFNDYATKYSKGSESLKIIPAKISKEMEDEIIKQAKDIFNILNCRDFARVDFFLNSKNEIIFNEINTLPGFKDTSIYSLMMADKGYSYKDVVNGLIEMALNRD